MKKMIKLNDPSFDELFNARMIYDKTFQPLYWDSLIPFIKFPHEWEIKIRPPFTGAIIRFSAIDPSVSEEEIISVYLDGYEMLGYGAGKPYWEAYPIRKESIRFPLKEIKELIECMKDEFERRKND